MALLYNTYVHWEVLLKILKCSFDKIKILWRVIEFSWDSPFKPLTVGRYGTGTVPFLIGTLIRNGKVEKMDTSCKSLWSLIRCLLGTVLERTEGVEEHSPQKFSEIRLRLFAPVPFLRYFALKWTGTGNNVLTRVVDPVGSGPFW